MKIKKLLFLSLLMFTILSITNIVNALVNEEIIEDGIRYRILTEEENNYTLVLAGYEGNPTTVTIPEQITYNSNIYDVISVEDNAFFRVHVIN